MVKKRKLNNLSLSVFFPCYNDAGSIALLVDDADKTLRGLTDDYEIVVVDDGSKDESREILKRLSKKYRRLKLVFHHRNLGYGGALKSGFKNSNKDYIFYTDGDGQYDVCELTKLTAHLDDQVDVVQGFKLRRHDPWYRIIIGNLYNLAAKFLFNLKIRDVDCDFRLIRSTFIKPINLKYNSGVICVELVKKLQNRGARIKEVGVSHRPRLHGHSQFFDYRRILRTLYELLELRLLLIVGKEA